MDLDPAPGVALADVVKATRLIHEFLTTLGLRSFLKTSGGKGFHVVVPPAKAFRLGRGQSLRPGCGRADDPHPSGSLCGDGQQKKAGGQNIYRLLTKRNCRGATSVAPYSTRANPGAPISMPMTWEELYSARAGFWLFLFWPQTGKADEKADEEGRGE